MILQRMLAEKKPDTQWEVENGGSSGMTAFGLSPEGNGLPSWTPFSTPAAQSIDVIVLMIGSNDAMKSQYYQMFEEDLFSKRLSAVVASLQRAAPQSKILMATPPPVTQGAWLDSEIVNKVFPRLIPAIANKLGLTCIDCFSPFQGQESNAIQDDGVHLTDVGARLVASAVCPHVMDAFGGASATPGPQLGATGIHNAAVNHQPTMPQNLQFSGGPTMLSQQSSFGGAYAMGAMPQPIASQIRGANGSGYSMGVTPRPSTNYSFTQFPTAASCGAYLPGKAFPTMMNAGPGYGSLVAPSLRSF
jgi:lysophospholipase L1-like esterase